MKNETFFLNLNISTKEKKEKLTKTTALGKLFIKTSNFITKCQIL